LYPLPKLKGYPDPPEKVTLLPAIEPPDEYVGLPIFHATDICFPLLYPISFRTLTRYGPVGIVLGTVKVAEVFSQVSDGI